MPPTPELSSEELKGVQSNGAQGLDGEAGSGRKAQHWTISSGVWKGFTSSPQIHGESLKGFNQGNDMIRFMSRNVSLAVEGRTG